MLPAAAAQPLRRHREHVRRPHQNTLDEGSGRVLLPDAIERKYPNSAQEWGWQWVFPQKRRWVDRQTGGKAVTMSMSPFSRERSARPS
jgi:hypothetical protein